MPRPVKESTALHLHNRFKASRCGNIRWAEAKGRVPLVDRIFHVMRRPAGGVLEEADAADGAVAAEVEPVLRSHRDVDEIPRFDLNCEHRAVLWMNVKHAA